MDLSHESVCFLAGAMYHVVTGTGNLFKAKDAANIYNVADAVFTRGKASGSVPEVTLSERMEIRRTLRKGYGYRRGLTRGQGGLGL